MTWNDSSNTQGYFTVIMDAKSFQKENEGCDAIRNWLKKENLPLLVKLNTCTRSQS